MKRAWALILAVLLVFSLCACGSSSGEQAATAPGTEEASQEPATPPDLTGQWEMVNKEGGEDAAYQTATITDDTITIYWVTGDTKALYWAGTFTPPNTADEPYTWESANDTEQTSTALLASSDATKVFTYQDGQLSFEASAMGVTKTVRMEKLA